MTPAPTATSTSTRVRPSRPRLLRSALAVALLATVAAACGGDGETASSVDDPGASGESSATAPASADGRPALPRPEPPAEPAVDRRQTELPTPFDPVVWTDPPPRPALEGPLAANDLLTTATIVGDAELEGAEDVAPGLDGHLYTGTIDGALWRLRVDADGGITGVEHVATLPGRALGLDAYSEDVLVAAVPEHGLMAVDTTSGDAWVLADRVDGDDDLVFFADAPAVADDGTVYVTEASTRYLPGFPNDFLDGRPNGRLLRYEPSSGELSVIADGMHFANGVDVAPDESYALVAESFRFRVLRVWLDGERAGEVEPFGEPLVNGPDNLRIDDEGRVWIGGSDLRNDATDALLANADLRRSVAALSDEERAELRAPYGFAVVLDPDGRPLASFHDDTGRFPGVSSVLLHEGTITFGTLAGRGLAQLPVPADLA